MNSPLVVSHLKTLEMCQVLSTVAIYFLIDFMILFFADYVLLLLSVHRSISY